MKGYLKRKREQGLNLIELMVVLSISAIAVFGIISMGSGVISGMEGREMANAINTHFTPAYPRARVRMDLDCDNDGDRTTNAAVGSLALGNAWAAVVAATAGSTPTPATIARARCINRLQQAFAGLFRSLPDDDGDLGSYDEDSVREWSVSASDTIGYDAAFRPAPADGDFEDLLPGGNATSTDTWADPCEETSASGIAVLAAPDMAACDAALSALIISTDGIFAANCAPADNPDDGNWAAGSNVDGEAVLAMCIGEV